MAHLVFKPSPKLRKKLMTQGKKHRIIIALSVVLNVALSAYIYLNK